MKRLSDDRIRAIVAAELEAVGLVTSAHMVRNRTGDSMRATQILSCIKAVLDETEIENDRP